MIKSAHVELMVFNRMGFLAEVAIGLLGWCAISVLVALIAGAFIEAGGAGDDEDFDF